MSLEQPTEAYTYKPGTIISIKLVNFMCHESFELNLGPRVNFIIGPNGSGKSALLTALVVVLGGRATTTSRGKRVNEFILYGKKYAKISCVIHNYEKIMDKDQAYKPDEYGKRITVEKIIYSEETSKLILKNDKDKKVSERKQELDDMLDHFGILINNPICILNQEISKTFLHSKRPEDKFELFMKATSLEQIEQDYLEAKMSHNEWNECNNSKKIGFRILDNEYLSCKEKLEYLINRAKLGDIYEGLSRELMWAEYRDVEEKLKASEQEMEKNTKELDKCDSKESELNDKIKDFECSIKKHQAKLAQCDHEYELSKKKLDEKKKSGLDIKSRRVHVNGKIETARNRIGRLEIEKKHLEKKIDELREKLHKELEMFQEVEKRKFLIESLESDIEGEKARQQSIRQHSLQLERSMNDTRADMAKTNTRVNELKTELSRNKSRLLSLTSGQQNKLRKYGENIVRICEEINQAHKNGEFKSKPLGPLGYFIRIKSAEIDKVLELHLKNNAFAFTCDNREDHEVLVRIFEKVHRNNPTSHQPTIVIRKIVPRHDTSLFKAIHSRHKTLLDYIDIEEDAVFNVLVDKCQLESVLYIPDYDEAQEIMIAPPLIPKNTRSAYTRDLYTIHPRTKERGYKSIANDGKRLKHLFSEGNAETIKEVRQTIEQINANVREVETRAKKLEEDYRTLRKEYDCNSAELTKIHKVIGEKSTQLLDLKTVLDPTRPAQLTAVEGELKECEEKITKLKVELGRDIEELKTIDIECEDFRIELEAIQKLVDARKEDRQDVIKLQDTDYASMVKCKNGLRENKINSEHIKTLRDKSQQKFEELTTFLATAASHITHQRPSTIRGTAEVRSELTKTKAQLDARIEGDADPDELLAALRKRMSEIESLISLKKHNELNFVTSKGLLKNRDDGFLLLRSLTCTNVATTFGSVMRAMNMAGELSIYLEDHVVDGRVVHKAKTLNMSIDTATSSQHPGGLTQNTVNQTPSASIRRQAQSQPTGHKRPRLDISPSDKENHSKLTDTRSLSGGERSFSTVAFVLALWHHCASPFKLMDEIDVFMDMVTRRISYNALIKFAQYTDDPGQFIFFSPLELPRIDDTENLVRVFEMPKIIRKGTQASISAGGDE